MHPRLRQTDGSTPKRPCDRLERARALAAQQRWREAAQVALLTPEAHPDRVDALLLAGSARRRALDLEDADQLLARAVEQGAGRFEPLLERAWLRFDQGRFDDGLRDAERALEIFDAAGGGAKRGEVLHALAFLHARLDDTAAAVRAADEWLECAGERSAVQRACARLFRRVGLNERALRACERALQIATTDGDRADAAAERTLRHELAELHLARARDAFARDRVEDGVRSGLRARELVEPEPGCALDLEIGRLLEVPCRARAARGRSEAELEWYAARTDPHAELPAGLDAWRWRRPQRAAAAQRAVAPQAVDDRVDELAIHPPRATPDPAALTTPPGR